jgi:hypothetical protein
MTTSKTGLLTGAAATLLVVAVTLVQGIWTERWTKQADDTALRHSAELLERDFPRAFGEWRFLQDMETSPEELARAGAVGSIARVFSHAVNKTAVSAFVVCATPHDASGHTPDRCGVRDRRVGAPPDGSAGRWPGSGGVHGHVPQDRTDLAGVLDVRHSRQRRREGGRRR